MRSKTPKGMLALCGQVATPLGVALVSMCGLVLTPGAAGKADPRLTERDDAYLNRQAEALLAQVNKTLNGLPPRLPEPPERRLALLLLDAVLHDVYAPNRAPVQNFYHARVEAALDKMENTHLHEGAVIWKLYNHGFIVRTPTVTLAFDLYRGPQGFRVDDPAKGQTIVPAPGFPLSDELASRLVRECDVLFISHRHEDHADLWIARAFLAQGKPVVAPPDVFEGTSIHGQVTHLKREAHTVQRLPIQKGTRDLKVVVYPGQQYQGRGIPNNVVLVFTPEGMSFAHNGDQINDPYPEYQQDYAWIAKVHEHHRVDVLMTNCWLDDLYRFTRGFDPELVVPGHENELGHSVFDRVPYWGDAQYLQLTYPQLLASNYPVLAMTWGESYHYKPKAR
jgi:L-ascorbate metabolism protein UlaG (beta-lactamase superfamily)